MGAMGIMGATGITDAVEERRESRSIMVTWAYFETYSAELSSHCVLKCCNTALERGS